MKKILAPFVGLTTVATVVAPIATSCASGTQEQEHVKASAINEMTAVDKKAQYVLILDSHDYDSNGFKVSTLVDETDKTGAKDENFTTTWTLDGDHLIVNVIYTGEDPTDNDITVKLNIHVKYGTSWSNKVAIKMRHQAQKGMNLEWDNASRFLCNMNACLLGSSYTFVADLNGIPETYKKEIPDFFRIRGILDSTEKKAKNIPFKDFKVKLNGKYLTNEIDYKCYNDGTIEGAFSRVKIIKQLQKTDILTFECVECASQPDNSETIVAQFYVGK